jgi:hypothetical protein
MVKECEKFGNAPALERKEIESNSDKNLDGLYDSRGCLLFLPKEASKHQGPNPQKPII